MLLFVDIFYFGSVDFLCLDKKAKVQKRKSMILNLNVEIDHKIRGIKGLNSIKAHQFYIEIVKQH
jgi:hypothetical protein